MLSFAWPAVWLRFDAAQRWPWVVMAGLLMMAIASRLRSRISPTAAFGLLAISGMLLALLEPVIGRPRKPSEAGPILLLLDVSQSMTAHDRLRTPRQRVALARALGRLPTDTVDLNLDRVRTVVSRLAQRVDALVSARAELDYARLLGRRSPLLRTHFESAITQLRDEALSNADAPTTQDRRLRSDIVALAGPGAAPGPARDEWLNRLGDLLRATRSDLDRAADDADDAAYQSRGDVRAACDAVSDLSRLELERLAALRVEGSIHAALGADMPVQAIAFGSGTRPIDLQATDLSELPRSPIGTETQLNVAARATGRDPSEPALASVLFSDGRPVGDAAAGGAGRDEDGWPVLVVRVAKPGAVRDVALSNLSLPTWAYRGQVVYARVQVQSAGLTSSAVDLQCRLGKSYNEQIVDTGDNTAIVVRPHVAAEGIGIQALKLNAVPRSAETIEGCGSIERSLRVIDRTVHVLLISDVPNSVERECLASLPFVRLTIAPPGKPAESNVINSADVIIFGGTDPQQLSPQEWTTLYRAVNDRGAGIVFLGESTDSMADVDDPTAAELIPWETGTQGSHRTPADSDLTLQMVGTEVGPLLGPLSVSDQWVPDEALPAAASPLLADAATRTPILIEKRIGAGRSLLLTVTPAPAKSADRAEMLARLWTILVRDAASPPFAVVTATQRLDVDPPVGDTGGSFHMRCETIGPTSPPQIELRQDGRLVLRRVLLVTNRSNRGTESSTTFARLPVGHYTVSLAGENTQGVEFDVTPPASTEMENLTGRSDVLRRIARNSGGAFFEPEECDAIVNRLKAIALAPRAPVEWRLSTGPQLLGFIVGCLAIDWALRKRAGLA